jgi:hypothetical protein
MCFSELWAQRRKRPLYTTFLLVYITTHFVAGTLISAGAALWSEMVWIDNRAYPGGPLAFYNQQEHWSNNMRNILSFIVAWLQDWLLVRDQALPSRDED